MGRHHAYAAGTAGATAGCAGSRGLASGQHCSARHLRQRPRATMPLLAHSGCRRKGGQGVALSVVPHRPRHTRLLGKCAARARVVIASNEMHAAHCMVAAHRHGRSPARSSRPWRPPPARCAGGLCPQASLHRRALPNAPTANTGVHQACRRRHEAAACTAQAVRSARQQPQYTHA